MCRDFGPSWLTALHNFVWKLLIVGSFQVRLAATAARPAPLSACLLLAQFHAVSCLRRLLAGLRAHHFHCGSARTHIFIYFETYFVSSIPAATFHFPLSTIHPPAPTLRRLLHTYYSYAPLNLCPGQFFIASGAFF